MASSTLIDDLEKQFADNPRRVFARLANEYRKSGEYDRAIAICRSHIPNQPSYISGYIVLGQALCDCQRYDEARQAFDTALGLDPENLIALRQLGDVARETGDADGARRWYQRSLEVDPQNEEVLAQLQALQPLAASEMPRGSESGVRESIDHLRGAAEQTSALVAHPVDYGIVSLEDLSRDAGPTIGAASNSEARGETGRVDFEDSAVVGLEVGAHDRGEGGRESDEENAERNQLGVEEREAEPLAGSSDIIDNLSDAQVSPMYDPLIGRMLDVEPPVAAPASAFLTQTMADLYLEQGFTGEAISIYRRLVAERPDDEGLRVRLEELEGGGADAGFAAPIEGASAELSRATNVRRFFGVLAARRAPRSARLAESGPPAGTGRDEWASMAHALFGDAPVSTYDDGIARTLASVYSEGATRGRSTGASGSREPDLSLDRLFDRDSAESSLASARDLSFDQFFASEHASVTPSLVGKEGADRARHAGGEADSDLDQFHAWLEGLTK